MLLNTIMESLSGGSIMLYGEEISRALDVCSAALVDLHPTESDKETLEGVLNLALRMVDTLNSDDSDMGMTLRPSDTITLERAVDLARDSFHWVAGYIQGIKESAGLTDLESIFDFIKTEKPNIHKRIEIVSQAGSAALEIGPKLRLQKEIG